MSVAASEGDFKIGAGEVSCHLDCSDHALFIFVYLAPFSSLYSLLFSTMHYITYGKAAIISIGLQYTHPMPFLIQSGNASSRGTPGVCRDPPSRAVSHEDGTAGTADGTDLVKCPHLWSRSVPSGHKD